jgi:hypothetical protein
MILSGVPLMKGENAAEIMERYASYLKIKLLSADIDISHRLPSDAASTGPPPIVVRFVRRTVKNINTRNSL